ncbi:MAG TPA: hypothetical protein VHO06_16000 [Polyangia bacterium]|nr:hypothetical protein [Polyangia bacterium]
MGSSRSSADPGRPVTPSVLTVVVNSTDSYEDCWAPFFTLFAKFWPACPFPILLNTERKDFSWPGLDVRATRVALGDGGASPPWGECLLRCLDLVESELVLYLQEDYFLSARVDVERMGMVVRRMIQEEHGHVSLTPFSNEMPWRPLPGDPILCAVDQNASFRINLQAGLWRTSTLRRHLRRHENPWQFEVWGTQRSHRVRESFLCVNPDALDRGEIAIVPYFPTGVVEGQWQEEAVIPLFQDHGIEIDFTRRGFHDRHAVKTRPRAWIGRRAWARLRSLV